MVLDKDAYLVFDSTIINNSEKIPIDEKQLDVDPIIFDYQNKIFSSSAHFIDLLSPVTSKTGLIALFPEEVAIESTFSDGRGNILLDDNLIKDEFPNRINFRRQLNRGSLESMEIISSCNKDFTKNKNSFLRNFDNDNDNKGFRVVSFNNNFKGKNYGDIAIVDLVSTNPDKKFFVVTSNYQLGKKMEDLPNADPMNLCGMYTSVRDFGILKEVGFKEDLPNGNVLDKQLLKATTSDNKRQTRYISRVVTSDSFEKALEESGKDRIKAKSTTLRTTFEDLLENRKYYAR